MKWSAIVAGVFAVAFLSEASAEGMAKATQSPKKEIQLASIVVPTWKDLGTKASTKKIRLVRVFKYWSALKARDKKAIKALYSNASDRSAAAMKVDKFYNGANQCLRKQKEFKRKTRAQVNQALSKVAQCIKRTVKPPTFTVPVTQALPADYYNPIMPDPSEYDKEDAEDATEDPTGTQPLPAVAPGADDEENTFETAAVDEPGEEAPTSTDPTEGIDFEDSYEEPAIQAPHDYSVGGPGSIYHEEQPVVEPPTGTYPQPVEEEGPTTMYQNEQPGEFMDNGIVHENQNMQPEEPPFNPELMYHNEQAPVPHDYSVGGPGSIYREEQPVVEPPTGSYPQPVEEEGPTTTYQGEERPEEVMPAGVDQLVAMNPNRWPFSPTSRDVPPLWALDLDSSNAVSLDEWAAYVKRLHGLAVEIASVGRDAHAVNLLMKIIDSHYRALDYCIHQKLGATGEKELKSPEFTDVAEWIQANCYVKFRYSLFAGVPPFEWIAEDQPTVSVAQVEKWFSEEVATARRDLTRIQAVPVTPEHQVVVEKFIACTDAVLKQAHNAPVDRDMYYGALRQIEECAHH